MIDEASLDGNLHTSGHGFIEVDHTTRDALWLVRTETGTSVSARTRMVGVETADAVKTVRCVKACLPAQAMLVQGAITAETDGVLDGFLSKNVFVYHRHQY